MLTNKKIFGLLLLVAVIFCIGFVNGYNGESENFTIINNAPLITYYNSVSSDTGCSVVFNTIAMNFSELNSPTSYVWWGVGSGSGLGNFTIS